jgi:hypothetical protein
MELIRAVRSSPFTERDCGLPDAPIAAGGKDSFLALTGAQHAAHTWQDDLLPRLRETPSPSHV